MKNSLKKEEFRGKKKHLGDFFGGSCDEDQTKGGSGRNIMTKSFGAIFNKNHWIW